MANDNSWFEKVPGNYYKNRTELQDDTRSRNDRSYSSHAKDRRNIEEYDDENDYDGYRRSNDRSRSINHQNGRSSDTYSDTAPREYDHHFEDREASERYDQAPSARHGRRGYENPGQEASTHSSDARGLSGQQHDGYNEELPTEEVAAGAFAAGVAAANMRNDTPMSESNHRNTPYTGYIPYADIYGDKQHQSGSNHIFSQPRSGSIGPQRDNDHNSTTTPYRANPATDYDEDYPQERNRKHRDNYNDNRQGHSSRSRPPLRSRSHDSYDSRDAVPRYQDSHRQDRSKKQQSDERGKSKSRLRTTFDKSQRGLGYGAVGALAGGIVGSGVGKGAIPTAVGAVLGGLGANIFEAKERRKDAARHLEYSKQQADGSSRRDQRERSQKGSDSGRG